MRLASTSRGEVDEQQAVQRGIVDDQQKKEEEFTSTNGSPGQSIQNFCSRMKLFPQA